MRIKEVNKRKEKLEKEGINQVALNWKLELPPGMMFTNPGSHFEFQRLQMLITEYNS